jgi:anti-sigma28 factor (negative regulator of flagellin synthesis)
MTLAGQIRLRKGPVSAPISADDGNIAHETRVENLRRLIAKGAYRIHPQKLALKILVKTLRKA